MADEKKYTEKTEVKTETKESWGSPKREQESEYKKETTVKTERTVEKDDDAIVIVETDD